LTPLLLVNKDFYKYLTKACLHFYDYGSDVLDKRLPISFKTEIYSGGTLEVLGKIV
jgi:hypothetical protein